MPVSDDEELFASVARNIAVLGEWRASQMYGNTRLNDLYDGAGPLHILLGYFLYRLVEPSNLGGVQVLFLATPIYAALTAGLIFLFARSLAFFEKAGVIAALIFGLGTIAWPYAQTFYREPLAALLLLSAWYCFTIANDKNSSLRSRWIFWGLFGILYIAALFTEIVLIVILPVFIIAAWLFGNLRDDRKMWGYLACEARQIPPRIPLTTAIPRDPAALLRLPCLCKWRWLGAVALVFLAVGVVWGLLNNHIDIYRFSVSFIRREIFARVINAPHDNFIEALTGSLISLGKGLFVLSPVLLLSVVALFKYWRSNKEIILIPWSSLLILAVVRALTFDAEWWDMTWGTRFLLPVIPLLVISTLPLLNELLVSRDKKIWLGTSFLIGFSVVLQMSNVLVNPQSHNSFLYQRVSQPYSGPALWDWRYSSLIRNWAALFSGHWDLAIKFSSQESPLLTSLFVFLAVALVIVSGFSLWNRLVRKSGGRLPLPKIVFLMIVIILLPLLLLHTFRADPRYSAQRADLVTANKFLSENVQSNDIVVMKAYLYPSWQHLMNYGRLQSIWYSLPLDIQSNRVVENGQEINLATLNLFNEFANSDQEHLWFLTEEPEVTSIEIYLSNRFARLQTWEFLGTSQIRISKYSNP